MSSPEDDIHLMAKITNFIYADSRNATTHKMQIISQRSKGERTHSPPQRLKGEDFAGYHLLLCSLFKTVCSKQLNIIVPSFIGRHSAHVTF